MVQFKVVLLQSACEKKAKDDAEWAEKMVDYQEKGMKQYLENQEKSEKGRRKGRGRGKGRGEN